MTGYGKGVVGNNVRHPQGNPCESSVPAVSLATSPKRLNPNLFVLAIVRATHLVSPKAADPVTAR